MEKHTQSLSPHVTEKMPKRGRNLWTLEGRELNQSRIPGGRVYEDPGAKVREGRGRRRKRKK